MKTLFEILLPLSIILFVSQNSFSLPVELSSFTASVKKNNVAFVAVGGVPKNLPEYF